MQKIFNVRADWDSEAKVWVATSEDIPGLATEAETVEALLAKLETMVPEMLEENTVDARSSINRPSGSGR